MTQLRQAVVYIGNDAALAKLIRLTLPLDSVIWRESLGTDPRSFHGTGAVRLVILDLDSIHHEQWAHFAETARVFASDAALVGIITSPPDDQDRLRDLSRVGLTDLILAGRERIAPLLKLHAKDETRRSAYVDALRLLRRTLPIEFVSIAEQLVESCSGIDNLEDLAVRVGSSRSTLERSARRELGMTLGALDRWIGLVVAAALLDRGARTIAGVALAVGFEDPRTLRSTTASLLGTQPRTLRRIGSLGQCVSAFSAAVAERPTRAVE